MACSSVPISQVCMTHVHNVAPIHACTSEHTWSLRAQAVPSSPSCPQQTFRPSLRSLRRMRVRELSAMPRLQYRLRWRSLRRPRRDSQMSVRRARPSSTLRGRLPHPRRARAARVSKPRLPRGAIAHSTPPSRALQRFPGEGPGSPCVSSMARDGASLSLYQVNTCGSLLVDCKHNSTSKDLTTSLCTPACVHADPWHARMQEPRGLAASSGAGGHLVASAAVG